MPAPLKVFTVLELLETGQQPRCLECIFSTQSDDGHPTRRICKRRAPETNAQRVQPIVAINDWCGDGLFKETK